MLTLLRTAASQRPIQQQPAMMALRHAIRMYTAPDPPPIQVHPQYLTTSFVRSSGPGGQNVNKLNTKAEARFSVAEAGWMPEEVRKRLSAQQASRVNNAGELVMTCDETRSQARNLKLCIARLQEMVDKAWVEPRERKLFTGLRAGTKEKRIKQRKARSNKKAKRSGRDLF
eukprot:TRINITY_DN21214_c0_g1_i2.p1 TRINITY_DN21214_c0_g1~~TRINITY_DN21214_c0_g1_i2.p1  ORF type:complete len:171 (+),score=39.61 TRINITY_DN21214_c0_g1_i2:196-708(+)